MKKEILTALLILITAICFSLFKESPNASLEESSDFTVQEHEEPVHLFFMPKTFKQEYYGITTSS